jgi:hypothetical protein
MSVSVSVTLSVTVSRLAFLQFVLARFPTVSDVRL